MAGPTPDIAERLWAKVDRNGPIPVHAPELGPCWPFTASLTSDGYGQIWQDRKPKRAHRVALSLSLGRPLAPDEDALHHCDNPPCCNPAHLRPGSQLDNAADMVARGRAATGDRNGMRRRRLDAQTIGA